MHMHMGMHICIIIMLTLKRFICFLLSEFVGLNYNG